MDAEQALEMLRKAADMQDLNAMTRKALKAAQWFKELQIDDGSMITAFQRRYADLMLYAETDAERVDRMAETIRMAAFGMATQVKSSGEDY